MGEETSNIAVKDTMEIILQAGDARVLITKAMECVADGDYEQAEKLMKQANEKLVAAHRIQTKKLQEEAEGENPKYSVLFTHAQDTLMTINSEYNISKNLINIFKKRDQRSS